MTAHFPPPPLRTSDLIDEDFAEMDARVGSGVFVWLLIIAAGWVGFFIGRAL